MKIRSFLFSVLCVLAIGLSFPSCSDDDDLLDEGSTLNLPKTRAYILNEGTFGMNNAGITFYAPNGDHDRVEDIYMTQNKKGLGDTGQDIIEYDNYLYVIVYGSNLLLKLNSACVEQARLSFPEEGQPRYVAEQGGKLYVTLYSGKVAKINPQGLEIEGYVTVGKNPDEIVGDGDFLYVVNSGWGADSTLSVISTKEFAVTKTIKVAKNPSMALESNGNIFVIAYGEDHSTPVLQKVDIEKESATTLANASRMCEYNGTVYSVFTEYDFVNLPSPYVKENRFFSYDTGSGTLKNANFLVDIPSEFATKVIYMMTVNPKNGDLYIGTSDYMTNGDIYRFDKNGKLIEKFESGGISPSKAVFF
jgi:hypothetical protein